MIREKYSIITIMLILACVSILSPAFANELQTAEKKQPFTRLWRDVGKLRAEFKQKGIECCPLSLDQSKTVIISIQEPGVLKMIIKYDKFPNWPDVDVSMPNSGAHWHAIDSNGHYNLGNYASILSDLFVKKELAHFYDPEKPMLGRPAQEAIYYEVRPGRGVFEIAPLANWGRSVQLGWLVEASFHFAPGIPDEGEEFKKDYSVSIPVNTESEIFESWGTLGNQWIVTEIDGWKGTWTRRPGTGIFDAVWKNANGIIVKDVIFVESVIGKSVILSRAGNKGKYFGTLSDSGLDIKGSTSWYPAGSQWSAVIKKETEKPDSTMPDFIGHDGIAGRWVIYSGGQTGSSDEREKNYRAILEIRLSDRGYDGKLKFDVYPDWENLNDFDFDGEKITFTRPPYLSRTYPQFYSFSVAGDKIDGLFWQASDDRRWKTWGEREKK